MTNVYHFIFAERAIARRLPVRHLILSGVIGGIAMVLALLVFSHWQLMASDFTWSWRAARALIDRQNPYLVIQPTGPYPYDAPFYYPLPAALIALPFAPFPATLAGSLFIGCSTALLAFGLVRQSPSMLLLLCSAPYFMALRAGQWSPLVTATMLLPALAPLAIVKPNVGIGIAAMKPTRYLVMSSTVFLLISLMILPSWPFDWFHALKDNRHSAPILSFPGCFLVLCLLRWRDPHARFLLALSVFPQRLLFYDQLALLLVAQTHRQRLVLVICSWIGFLGWQTIAGPYTFAAPSWVLWWCYLPALVVVLIPFGQRFQQRSFRDIRSS